MAKKLKVILLEDLINAEGMRELSVLERRRKMLENVYSMGTVIDKGVFKSTQYFVIEGNKEK